ncbi:hypothetical protein ACNCRD_004888 [Escherichia coli]|jgi:hypothetical protein|uniref:CPS-53 (KpLE1) prophage protein n=17 Tax=root TaxID=1 RepID=A0A066Q4V0_ECOLX|nr:MULTISPECIES: hypothetical protein [Escherichia]YP_007001436.1 hypothetical protein F366_gp03 [Escherichia phage TL-2011c]YP_009907834.1 hypothetical protein H3H22_gp56 [Escherichia phage Lyz12581Vzw]AMD43106.1 hypothetical protein [Escherichia phage phiON-2011]AVD99079.1 hypothetical protein [Escherichia phage GER2]EER1340277.1 hypothetical protein [Escherichia coli O111:H8]EEZ8895626.1 hypothetical protein [Escherichia coli O104]EFT1069278.1 hypothetical protein [Shigella sonnei]EFY455
MNQHQTDVNVFINDLDGGVFVNKLGAVLSEVAFGVNSTNKKGKVCVEFELSSLDENRVSVSHKLKFTRPTMRGSKSEEDTTNTPMFVNKGGELTLFQKDQGQLFDKQGQHDAVLR